MLVFKVRENCDPGYIVPHVCRGTNMKLIMAKGDGNLFTYALAGRDDRHQVLPHTAAPDQSQPAQDGDRVPSRVRRAHLDTENFCLVLDHVTTPTYGPLDTAIGRLPLLARRANAAERALLVEQANKYLALTT